MIIFEIHSRTSTLINHKMRREGPKPPRRRNNDPLCQSSKIHMDRKPPVCIPESYAKSMLQKIKIAFILNNKKMIK